MRKAKQKKKMENLLRKNKTNFQNGTLCAQEFFHGFLSSYLGASPTEFQEYFLQIPSVSRGVVCFHSDGLGCSWTFTVIVFKDLRASILFVSMYISLVFSLHVCWRMLTHADVC